jgi:hypothetical protein
MCRRGVLFAVMDPKEIKRIVQEFNVGQKSCGAEKVSVERVDEVKRNG